MIEAQGGESPIKVLDVCTPANYDTFPDFFDLCGEPIIPVAGYVLRLLLMDYKLPS